MCGYNYICVAERKVILSKLPLYERVLLLRTSSKGVFRVTMENYPNRWIVGKKD